MTTAIPSIKKPTVMAQLLQNGFDELEAFVRLKPRSPLPTLQGNGAQPRLQSRSATHAYSWSNPRRREES